MQIDAKQCTVSQVCSSLQTTQPITGRITSLQRYNAGLPDVFGWSHGMSSRCLPVTYKFVASSSPNIVQTYPSSGNQGDNGAACFNVSCDAQNHLWVNMLGQTIRCPTGAT